MLRLHRRSRRDRRHTSSKGLYLYARSILFMHMWIYHDNMSLNTPAPLFS